MNMYGDRFSLVGGASDSLVFLHERRFLGPAVRVVTCSRMTSASLRPEYNPQMQ